MRWPFLKLFWLLLCVFSLEISGGIVGNKEGVEPAVGIEPTTDGLQNRCSTAELSWRP